MKSLSKTSLVNLHGKFRMFFSESKIQGDLNKQRGTIAREIEFLSDNKKFINNVLELNLSQNTLKNKHQQFIQQLRSQTQQGKRSFEKVQKSMSNLYQSIKTNILKEPGFSPQSQFIQRSHYYFQSQGKKIRPIMVSMLAQSFQNQSEQANQNVRLWGALIEMMHISSLAHDDIIDDSPSRRGLESQHIRYGKKSAVFSANFIISKASQAIYDFNNILLYQIYSTAMDNLATGQVIQALNKNKISDDIQQLKPQLNTYMDKTYYKTAALMANALRAVPLFYPKTNFQHELASYKLGQHFGIAFQLVDDILDYVSTTQQMGKEGLADIIEGNVTAPVYFSLWTDKKQGKIDSKIMNSLKTVKKTKQHAENIKQWVFKNSGIELSYALAEMHISKGLEYLKHFSCQNQQTWKYLALKILNRKK